MRRAEGEPLAMCPHIATAICLLLAAGTPAIAQERGRPLVGGYVGGTAGADGGAALGAFVGKDLSPWISATVEIGHLNGVLPRDVRASVERASDLLAAASGDVVNLRFGMSATYALSRVRLTRGSSVIAPYFELGGGLAHVRPRVAVAQVGKIDLKAVLERVLEDEQARTTEPLVALGGGVALGGAKRLGVDVGVRWMRIATDAPTVAPVLFYGAARVLF